MNTVCCAIHKCRLKLQQDPQTPSSSLRSGLRQSGELVCVQTNLFGKHGEQVLSKEERDHSTSLMVRDASFFIELAAGTTGMAQKCRNVYIGFRTTCAPTRVGRPIIFQQDNSKLHLISSLCSIVNKLWVYELCKLSCKCGKFNLTEFTFLAMCKLVRIISTVKVELQHVVCVQKH